MTNEYEIIDKLRNVKDKYGDTVVIENFERNVLQIKNPELSYFFANEIIIIRHCCNIWQV